MLVIFIINHIILINKIIILLVTTIYKLENY